MVCSGVQRSMTPIGSFCASDETPTVFGPFICVCCVADVQLVRTTSVRRSRPRARVCGGGVARGDDLPMCGSVPQAEHELADIAQCFSLITQEQKVCGARDLDHASVVVGGSKRRAIRTHFFPLQLK